MATCGSPLESHWPATEFHERIALAALIEPRKRAIDRLAREAPAGPLPQSLEQRTHDPVLLTALLTIATLLLGIVFLMTTKPALTGSLIVIAIALALGLASGALASRTMRTPGQSVAARESR